MTIRTRLFSLLLAVIMVISLMPMSVLAADEHVHDEEALATTVEEAAEVPSAEAVVESTPAAEDEAAAVVCTCESDDPASHAPFCALYTAPEAPACLCVEQCAEGSVNEWCDVCYFDHAACAASGEEEAAVYADTPTYVASIGIDQDGSSGSTGINDCKAALSGHTIIDRDLNDGAGGDYVYMGYKTTTDPTKAITGIVFCVGGSPPDSITYDGATFNLVGGKNEANTAKEGGYIDLNASAGGDYIYMYVTRDPNYNAPLTEIIVNESQLTAGYNDGNNTSGKLIDLNQDAGGKYLYLHYKRFSKNISSVYSYIYVNEYRVIDWKQATSSHVFKNHLEKHYIPEVPSESRENTALYIHEGWREDDIPGEPTIKDAYFTSETGDRSFRAVYRTDVVIAFHANGGSGEPSPQRGVRWLNAGGDQANAMKTTTVNFTIPNDICTHPNKCKFLGWSINPYDTEPSVFPGTTIDPGYGGAEFYAIYADHSYTNGVCTGCGKIDLGAGVILSKNGKPIFASDSLDTVIAEAKKCAAADKAVVNLQQNIDVGSNILNIDSGVFTLDLNGFELKGDPASELLLSVKGPSVITLQDSVGTGKLSGGVNVVSLEDGAAMTIAGGTIDGKTGVSVKDSALTIIGGTINVNESSGIGVFAAANSEITISGGTINVNESSGIGVFAAANSKITISGGTISGNGYSADAVFAAANSKVTMSGGTINVTGNGFYMEDPSADITISGGSIRGEQRDFDCTDKVCSVRLTVGENGVGATFPSDLYIVARYMSLGGILDDGAAYWAGDTMLAFDESGYHIRNKGDITVKAKCTHEGGSMTYVNTGTNHRYLCSICKLEDAEKHTFTDSKCVCGAQNHTCQYTNGFCENGCYEPAELVDGYYQIGNGGQLFWFAEYSNMLNRNAKAKLTADIDLENRAWTPIGFTGEGKNNFRGHFDGQDHTITGLNVNANRSGAGFFGEVRLGKVENFTIKGNVTVTANNITYVGGVIGSAPGATGDNVPDHNGATIRNITSYVNVTVNDGLTGVGRIGGFMGYANHETLIENCAWYGTIDLGNQTMNLGAGGFIGRVNEKSAVTIRNCGAYGSIVNDSVTENVGAFMGLTNTGSNTVIENCLFAGSVSGTKASSVTPFGTWSGASKTLTNSYYINTLGTTDAGATAVTPDQLASGEITLKLGTAWGQNLGSDAFPVPGGATVYQVKNCINEVAYNNTNENVDHILDGATCTVCGNVFHEHSYDNGTCTICGVVCPHKSYDNSICTVCGMKCKHSIVDGFCTVCGVACPHESYDNGFCAGCGVYEPAVFDGDSYLISNAGQLYWFAAQVNDGQTTINGKLTANITVNENVLKEDGSLNGNGKNFRVWTPIGNNTKGYKGTFDGNGKTISGLYFSDRNIQYVGLFGCFFTDGKVQNVGVTDSYFYAYNNVGGLVGRNIGGTVIGCHNAGTIYGNTYGNNNIGGVVGENYTGTVENCYNTGVVARPNNSSQCVGGVVGKNCATVINCYNTGTISGDRLVGGVVGYNNSGATITNCYNTGAVDGGMNSTNVGGVVGSGSGTTTNCYNTGTVDGYRYVGGVMGYRKSGTTTNCYNTGAVSGTEYVGGVAGTSDGTIKNCYYNSMVYSGEAVGSGSGYSTNVEGKTTEQFESGEVAYLLGKAFGQTIGTEDYPILGGAKVYYADTDCGAEEDFDYTNFETPPHNWSDSVCTECGTACVHHFENSKCVVCGKECKEHIFENCICTICGVEDDHSYDNGFCTVCGGYEPAKLVDGYYQIGNGGQLFWFANHINTVDNTASAMLTADINLENRAWTPMGTEGSNAADGFRGTFDGNGKTISGLNVTAADNGVGFIGEVRDGTVKNFTIYGEVKVNSKKNYVGGVIGSACGTSNDKGATISGITSYVNVTLGEGSHASGCVAGLVGYVNHNTSVENCAWYGTLDLSAYRAQDGVGGLVGKANSNYCGTIRNCGAYGTIKTSYQSLSFKDFDTIYIGGIVSNSLAKAQTKIENCIWAGTIVNNTNLGTKAYISAVGTLNGFASVTGCYALNNAPYVTTNGAQDSYITSVTAEQMASGEVTYKLGAAWGQTIGTEDYPVLGGKNVYCGYTDCDDVKDYSNNSAIAQEKPNHNWSNSDGVCVDCGDVCVHSFVGSKCTVCGTAAPFAFYGSNVTLGNELDLNFAVEKDILPDGAYGKINGTEVKWTYQKQPDGTELMLLTYSGLAAKEMGTEVTATVYDKDGKLLGTREDSIMSYAMRSLENPDFSKNAKPLLIKMLDYGAAAQVEFGYDAENHVNAEITEAMRTDYPFQSKAVTNSGTPKDDVYMGTSLVLENRIEMQMGFVGDPTGVTARVTYKHHDTTPDVDVTITADKFYKYTDENGNVVAYGVIIPDIMVADARQDVTVTLTFADETTKTVTDSIESYVARNNSKGIYGAIMDFSDAAYKYLHPEGA